MTKSCTESARCSRKCPATTGRNSPTCGCSSANVRASRQEADLHGQRTRAAERILGSAAVEWSLEKSPWHRGIQRLVADLNRLHRTERALHEVDFEWSGFEWIDANDAASSVLTFLRRAKNRDDFVVAVCNFTPVVREEYRVGVPRPGFYREILNTDSRILRRHQRRQRRRRASRANPVERSPLFHQAAPPRASPPCISSLNNSALVSDRPSRDLGRSLVRLRLAREGILRVIHCP